MFCVPVLRAAECIATKLCTMSVPCVQHPGTPTNLRNWPLTIQNDLVQEDSVDSSPVERLFLDKLTLSCQCHVAQVCAGAGMLLWDSILVTVLHDWQAPCPVQLTPQLQTAHSSAIVASITLSHGPRPTWQATLASSEH